MKGAPALEATTRSPLQSMTTSPRMDWRSSLVSQTMPRILSPTMMGEENHEWSRRWMPLSRARPSAARFRYPWGHPIAGGHIVRRWALVRGIDPEPERGGEAAKHAGDVKRVLPA